MRSRVRERLIESESLNRDGAPQANATRGVGGEGLGGPRYAARALVVGEAS